MENTAQGPEYEVEKVMLPQIASIKQASKIMSLPPYYLRRLCKEVSGLAFQSGVKWYIKTITDCFWSDHHKHGLLSFNERGAAVILTRPARLRILRSIQ